MENFRTEFREVVIDLLKKIPSLGDWANIKNKPKTFPPSPHTHKASEIIGLQQGGSSGGSGSSSSESDNKIPYDQLTPLTGEIEFWGNEEDKERKGDYSRNVMVIHVEEPGDYKLDLPYNCGKAAFVFNGDSSFFDNDFTCEIRRHRKFEEGSNRYGDDHGFGQSIGLLFCNMGNIADYGEKGSEHDGDWYLNNELKLSMYGGGTGESFLFHEWGEFPTALDEEKEKLFPLLYMGLYDPGATIATKSGETVKKKNKDQLYYSAKVQYVNISKNEDGKVMIEVDNEVMVFHPEFYTEQEMAEVGR